MASVSSADFALYGVDDRVRGTLVGVATGQPEVPYRLEGIWPTDPRSLAMMAAVNQRLRAETLRAGPKAFKAVGERIPDFALFDHRGDVFESRSLHGCFAVVGFIFTRCQVPEMCPATTRKMRELQALAAEAGRKDVDVILISFDPAYDTLPLEDFEPRVRELFTREPKS